jgi:hypothetical protein
MGWLSDRIVQYVYSDGEEEIIIEAKASDEVPPAPKGYKYKGFLPEKVNLMTKVQFEQNGRVGYKVSLGDGKHLYRSATREKYEHIVGNTPSSKLKSMGRGGEGSMNESVYTKSYGEAVKKTEKANVDKHNRNLKKILKGGK